MDGTTRATSHLPPNTRHLYSLKWWGDASDAIDPVGLGAGIVGTLQVIKYARHSILRIHSLGQFYDLPIYDEGEAGSKSSNLSLR